MIAQSHETSFNKGVVLQEQGKYEQSLDYFQQSIAIQPDFIPAWIYQGISLEKLQRYPEAIACYDQAIELHPDVADIWYNKGATLCKIKRYPDALKCFERVLELEPDHALVQTAQTLVIAIPPVLNPMPKLTESDKDKEDAMSEEARLYLTGQREISAYIEGEAFG